MESTESCPYCGEPLEVLVDPQDLGVPYIEDCQVCCRPIVFSASLDGDGELQLMLRSEDES